MLRSLLAYLILGSCFIIAGCGAMHVALSKKDLDVQTKMNTSVFLDLENPAGRKIYTDFRNTSGKNIRLKDIIIYELSHKGYEIVYDPAQANYILQVNVLSCEKTSPAALNKALRLGYGVGTVGAGVATGALIGATTHSYHGMARGAAVGGLVAGVGGLVADSLVKDVTYALLTDIKITEKKLPDRQIHEVRLAASANKVNLELSEAQRPLEEAMAKAIANIF